MIALVAGAIAVVTLVGLARSAVVLHRSVTAARASVAGVEPTRRSAMCGAGRALKGGGARAKLCWEITSLKLVSVDPVPKGVQSGLTLDPELRFRREPA